MLKNCFSAKIRRFVILGSVAILFGCATPPPPDQGPSKVHIVATTSMLGDTIQEIGGDLVHVDALMKPGVDPHTYQSTAHDEELLEKADLVISNGLDLEAGMTESIKKMESAGKLVYATRDLPKTKLISIEENSDQYDPHVWLDPGLWTNVTRTIANAIIAKIPKQKKTIDTNLEYFDGKLRMLDQNIRIALGRIPKDKRILVTAHDAFGYFGKLYDFDTYALKGVDESDAGGSDAATLKKMIIDKKVPAVFVETTISDDGIKNLADSLNNKDHKTDIGRPIYSGSIGEWGTAQASYIGMLRFDAGIISEELTPPDIKDQVPVTLPAVSPTPALPPAE